MHAMSASIIDDSISRDVRCIVRWSISRMVPSKWSKMVLLLCYLLAIMQKETNQVFQDGSCGCWNSSYFPTLCMFPLLRPLILSRTGAFAEDFDLGRPFCRWVHPVAMEKCNVQLFFREFSKLSYGVLMELWAPWVDRKKQTIFWSFKDVCFCPRCTSQWNRLLQRSKSVRKSQTGRINPSLYLICWWNNSKFSHAWVNHHISIFVPKNWVENCHCHSSSQVSASL